MWCVLNTDLLIRTWTARNKRMRGELGTRSRHPWVGYRLNICLHTPPTCFIRAADSYINTSVMGPSGHILSSRTPHNELSIQHRLNPALWLPLFPSVRTAHRYTPLSLVCFRDPDFGLGLVYIPSFLEDTWYSRVVSSSLIQIAPAVSRTVIRLH